MQGITLLEKKILIICLIWVTSRFPYGFLYTLHFGLSSTPHYVSPQIALLLKPFLAKFSTLCVVCLFV